MTAPSPTSTRLVMLLTPVDKKRLQSLLATNRSLPARSSAARYTVVTLTRLGGEAEEMKMKMKMKMKAIFAEMVTEFDKALATIRSARTEIAENLSSIRKLWAQRP